MRSTDRSQSVPPTVVTPVAVGVGPAFDAESLVLDAALTLPSFREDMVAADEDLASGSTVPASAFFDALDH